MPLILHSALVKPSIDDFAEVRKGNREERFPSIFESSTEVGQVLIHRVLDGRPPYGGIFEDALVQCRHKGFEAIHGDKPFSRFGVQSS